MEVRSLQTQWAASLGIFTAYKLIKSVRMRTDTKFGLPHCLKEKILN